MAWIGIDATDLMANISIRVWCITHLRQLHRHKHIELHENYAVMLNCYSIKTLHIAQPHMPGQKWMHSCRLFTFYITFVSDVSALKTHTPYGYCICFILLSSYPTFAPKYAFILFWENDCNRFHTFTQCAEWPPFAFQLLTFGNMT